MVVFSGGGGGGGSGSGCCSGTCSERVPERVPDAFSRSDWRAFQASFRAFAASRFFWISSAVWFFFA
jgi:hypothetical protein